MTFKEYQKGVMKTWNTSMIIEHQIDNAIYGLVGELGEIVELYKKARFHGIVMDYNKLGKEIGDLQYYLTVLADIEHFELEALAELNNEKLAKRYPKGFVKGGGIR